MYFTACSTYSNDYYTITILYCTVLYCTVLYCTILYYTILYYTILYYTILYYTILYYTILYYTILYYIARQLLQHFLRTYILENTSSEAQQPKSMCVILNEDRRESSLECGIAENIMEEIQFQRYFVCIFYRKWLFVFQKIKLE